MREVNQRRDIVVLAASLGGLSAIRDLAAALPASFDAAFTRIHKAQGS